MNGNFVWRSVSGKADILLCFCAFFVYLANHFRKNDFEDYEQLGNHLSRKIREIKKRIFLRKRDAVIFFHSIFNVYPHSHFLLSRYTPRCTVSGYSICIHLLLFIIQNNVLVFVPSALVVFLRTQNRLLGFYLLWNDPAPQCSMAFFLSSVCNINQQQTSLHHHN